MYYMKSLKSPTHIHIFDEKFLWIRDSFLHYDFGILPNMRVLCRAKILPQIYTRIIASLKPPPYTRIIREKNFAPDIYNNCGAFGICERLIERWYLCVRFVSCFVYAVIVWIRSFLLIGRLFNVKIWL